MNNKKTPPAPRLPQRLDDLPSNALRPLGALHVNDLRAWAQAGGHRFIEADLGACADKKSVLRTVGQAFAFPAWFGANLDALYDSLTDLPAQAPAPGYLVVLQRLPYTEHFGVDERDALLDVLREATEALADLAVPLRVFYS